MEQLTSKDLQVLNALLLIESCANKKCAMHVNCLTDKKLQSLSKTLATNHKSRFEALFKLLEASK